jgi:hypothetical protein
MVSSTRLTATARWLPVLWLATCACQTDLLAEELIVPAFTAYTLPDADAVRISEQRGVTRWSDPAQSINWYGQLKQAGELTARLRLRLTPDQPVHLRLTVDGQSREARGTGDTDKETTTLDFGTFVIGAPGYQRFMLETLLPAGQPVGALLALQLDGPAVQDALFNLKERRNAASVHLMYPVPEGSEIAAFYCEVTAVEDPTTTFYMACGWHRGYFGMQVNSPTERRIIFSVWDSGKEAVDRNKVSSENRVTLMGKGAGVYSGDFGNEGTGGHSHLKTLWRTGEKQCFLVTAEPVEETFTIYSGYWLQPDEKRWMLISSWKAPHEGGWLKRPHSFSENFGGSSGHLVRKALYGNQWMRTVDGQWHELNEARFSHDATGKADRLDRCMGIEGNAFFLRHGGFVEGFTPYGQSFTRAASQSRPEPLQWELPSLPVSQP